MDDKEYKNFLDTLCYKSPVELGTDTNTEDNDPTYVYNDDIFSHGWKFDLDEALNDHEGVDADNQLHMLTYHSTQQDRTEQANESIYDESARSADTHSLANLTPGPVIISEDHQAKYRDPHQNQNNNHLHQHLISPPDYPFASSSLAIVHEQQQQQDQQQQLLPLPLPTQAVSLTPDIKSPSKRRRLEIFNDPEFARVLNHQLRQHIQLLTQTYLLTKNTTSMRSHAENARGHLDSYMKIFKNKCKPSNLLAALELVNNLPTPKDLQSSIRLSWRHLPIPEPVRRTTQRNPKVFMYKNLLPQVAFSLLPEKLIPKKSKINFTLNEDNLLAFALNEFKGESSQYAFIASLLMPAKTKMQISNHIKNIKRSPGNEDSPIKLYFSHGELPTIDLDADSEFVGLGPEVEEIFGQDNCDQSRLSNLSVEPADKGVGQQQQQQQQLERREKIEGVEIENGRRESENILETHAQESQQQLLPQQQQPQPLAPSSEEDQRVAAPTPASLAPVPVEAVPPVQHDHCPGVGGDGDDLILYNDDDIMNMDLDDLMAASTTISKSNNLTTIQATNTSENSSKNIKNLKLRRSMLSLMSHKFSLSRDLGDRIIHDFLKSSQEKLSERNYLHLLQLLTNLMKKEIRVNGNNNNNNNGATPNVMRNGNSVVKIHRDISEFLNKIQAPSELHDKLVLFLNFDQATKCGCALNYLHWMRFFEFIRHVELYHEGDAIEKKLARLIDALQKDDPHKLRLAAASLVNKHPLLKRDFDSLSLEAKPHASLFLCEDDFDDITEPISMIDADLAQQQQQPQQTCGPDLGGDTNFRQQNETSNSSGGATTTGAASGQLVEREKLYQFEHFQSKPTKGEIHYATQSCPCHCHEQPGKRAEKEGKMGATLEAAAAASELDRPNCKRSGDGPQPIGKHCGKCNLKFIKGKMYLVNKIKPILARWTYTSSTLSSAPPNAGPTTPTDCGPQMAGREHIDLGASQQRSRSAAGVARQATTQQPAAAASEWTFEEDKEILEFCQAKAEQNEETVSFDSATFEEFVQKRRHSQHLGATPPGASGRKRSARQIAERFNQLMEMYKMDENSSCQ